MAVPPANDARWPFPIWDGSCAPDDSGRVRENPVPEASALCNPAGIDWSRLCWRKLERSASERDVRLFRRCIGGTLLE